MTLMKIADFARSLGNVRDVAPTAPDSDPIDEACILGDVTPTAPESGSLDLFGFDCDIAPTAIDVDTVGVLGPVDDVAPTMRDSDSDDSVASTEGDFPEDDYLVATLIDNFSDASGEHDQSQRSTDVDSSSDDDAPQAAVECPSLSCSQALENSIRKAAMLPACHELHPCGLRPFQRLASALRAANDLAETRGYADAQLGVFAGDLGRCGAKCWYVDTFAGFALANAPIEWSTGDALVSQAMPYHVYEVLRSDRPCWLYFDLEYPVEFNTLLDPKSLMRAFYSILNSFCSVNFALEVDPDSIFELNSTTSAKFSKHVIIKSLKPPQAKGCDDVSPRALAFRSNTEAGVFVSRFLEHALGLKEDPASPATLLFVRTGASGKEAPFVDTSVYSRNRCFRVMFSSKMGKRHPLLPAWEVPAGRAPAELLLGSLASFVPEGTPLFDDPLVARGAPRPSGTWSGSRRRPAGARAAGGFRAVSGAHGGLAEFLVRFWDAQRRSRGGGPPAGDARRTFARSPWISGDGRFLAFTLQNNRFCFCKGASHKSNGVYLVVDCASRTFYQKCHDIDCRGFRTTPYPLPSHLFPTAHSLVSANAVDVAVAPAADEATCWTPVRRKRRLAGATPTPPRRVSGLRRQCR